VDRSVLRIRKPLFPLVRKPSYQPFPIFMITRCNDNRQLFKRSPYYFGGKKLVIIEISPLHKITGLCIEVNVRMTSSNHIPVVGGHIVVDVAKHQKRQSISYYRVQPCTIRLFYESRYRVLSECPETEIHRVVRPFWFHRIVKPCLPTDATQNCCTRQKNNEQYPGNSFFQILHRIFNLSFLYLSNRQKRNKSCSERKVGTVIGSSHGIESCRVSSHRNCCGGRRCSCTRSGSRHVGLLGRIIHYTLLHTPCTDRSVPTTVELAAFNIE